MADDEYRVRNGDITEIKERLAGIETFQEFIKERLDKMPLPGEGQVCRFEKGRLDKLEAAVGKQNFLAGTIGAVAAGLVLALRYVIGER